MTKAEHVLKLLGSGKTDKQIAAIVGCAESYVRYNRNRPSSVDCRRRNYLKTIATALRNSKARETARAERRQAYQIARAEGLSTKAANCVAGTAYGIALKKLGRQRTA